MRDLAWTIGFTHADLDPFNVLGRGTVVGQSVTLQVTKGSSWSVAHSRAIIECLIMSVPPWQQPANASIGEGVHVLCWGHPTLLLPFCNEFWDGESIWMLDDESRQVVKGMNAQWSKEVGVFICI